MPRPGFATLLPLLLASACATSPPVVPEKLAPAANESLLMIVPAKGVQIYECRVAKAGGFEWAFIAPEAALYDSGGNPIGKHYAGPHWEANDGSKVLGTLKERADAPTPDAIPWLLLTTKSTGRAGTFSRVSSIQRIATVGGVAPASGCDGGAVGRPARVPYTADYYFYQVR